MMSRMVLRKGESALAWLRSVWWVWLLTGISVGMPVGAQVVQSDLSHEDVLAAQQIPGASAVTSSVPALTAPGQSPATSGITFTSIPAVTTTSETPEPADTRRAPTASDTRVDTTSDSSAPDTTAHPSSTATASDATANNPAAVPALRAHVTDTTGTLDATRRQALEQQLSALEQRKGAQVAVLIVPTTAPDTIEQFATRVFDHWKLGREGTDDGVLLVMAKDDRALRIEVGYGLEGAITDAMSGRIIREQIVPRLQADDYAGGIEAGVTAIEKLIDGESLPPPSAEADDGLDDDDIFWFRLFGLGVIFLMVVMPTPIAGIYLAFTSWFVYESWWAFVLGGVVGLLVSGILGVLGIKRRVRAWLGSGGGGGGLGGGGSRGGGGFSGGGGRSGGGGASGSW